MLLHQNIIIAIVCFSLSLFALFFLSLQRFAAIPQEKRDYYDQLPRGFSLLWPIIRLLVHFFGPYISRHYRKRTHLLLCHGGADYILSTEQFLLSHLAAGAVVGTTTALLFSLLSFSSLQLLILLTLLGASLPSSWLSKRIKCREKTILRSLPLYLDILTLALESGSNFTSALSIAIRKSKPCPLGQELKRVLRDLQGGKTRLEALNSLRIRVKLDAINSFVSSVIQSENTGSPLGKSLRAQADQRRFERFSLAEKLGMEAPVKLLGPLVTFIFPTTFFIIIFLIIVKIHQTGIGAGGILDVLMLNPLDNF